MEIKVEEIKALEPIKFNYDEIKAQLSEQLKKYDNIIYTEETMNMAKTDRATLNKVKKAINDEKIRIKNIILEDYTANFEPKCKELMEMIENVSVKIDEQVKTFERLAKDEKLKEIMNYWLENVNEFADLINFDLIFEERWLNTTYTMSKIQAEITHIFEKARMDLSTLDATIKDPIINKQVKVFYFKNVNNPSVLGLSIQEATRIEDTNKKLNELEKTQDEEKVTKEEENQTNNEQKNTNEEKLIQLDFRAWVTKAQMTELKAFLKEKNIKYGRVE